MKQDFIEYLRGNYHKEQEDSSLTAKEYIEFFFIAFFCNLLLLLATFCFVDERRFRIASSVIFCNGQQFADFLKVLCGTKKWCDIQLKYDKIFFSNVIKMSSYNY